MKSDCDIDIRPIALTLLNDDMAVGADRESNETSTLVHDKTAERSYSVSWPSCSSRCTQQSKRLGAKKWSERIAYPVLLYLGVHVILGVTYIRMLSLYWSRDEAFLLSGCFDASRDG